MRILRVILIVHYPEVVVADADVKAIPVFIMGEKETHGAVLRKNWPLQCTFAGQGHMARDRQIQKGGKNRWQSKRKSE